MENGKHIWGNEPENDKSKQPSSVPDGDRKIYEEGYKPEEDTLNPENPPDGGSGVPDKSSDGEE